MGQRTADSLRPLLTCLSGDVSCVFVSWSCSGRYWRPKPVGSPRRSWKETRQRMIRAGSPVFLWGNVHADKEERRSHIKELERWTEKQSYITHTHLHRFQGQRETGRCETKQTEKHQKHQVSASHQSKQQLTITGRTLCTGVCHYAAIDKQPT